MAERKAVIKNADMSEDMQQDAVDCASQALEKYNIEKVRGIIIVSSSTIGQLSTLLTKPTSFTEIKLLKRLSVYSTTCSVLSHDKTILH